MVFFQSINRLAQLGHGDEFYNLKVVNLCTSVLYIT